MTDAYVYSAIIVMSAATVATRALPFLAAPLIAHNQTIQRLGQTLPPAILVILVAYCLSGVTWTTWPHGIPEIISLALCVLIHLWKRNALLSIACGTACFVIALQVWH